MWVFVLHLATLPNIQLPPMPQSIGEQALRDVEGLLHEHRSVPCIASNPTYVLVIKLEYKHGGVAADKLGQRANRSTAHAHTWFWSIRNSCIKKRVHIDHPVHQTNTHHILFWWPNMRFWHIFENNLKHTTIDWIIDSLPFEFYLWSFNFGKQQRYGIQWILPQRIQLYRAVLAFKFAHQYCPILLHKYSGNNSKLEEASIIRTYSIYSNGVVLFLVVVIQHWLNHNCCSCVANSISSPTKINLMIIHSR